MSVTQLDSYIEELLELYYSHIRQHFRHKLHNHIHITSAIRAIGPTANYSALRGEAKHQSMKKYINSSNCRINVSLTVAKKEGFRMAAEALDTTEVRPEIRIIGKKNKCNDDPLRDRLTNLGLELDETFEVTGVVFRSKKFKTGYAILVGNDVYEIKSVFTDKKDIAIVSCIMKTNFIYDENVRCFKEVDNHNNASPELHLFNLRDVKYEPSIIIDMPSGARAVKFWAQFESY